MEIEKINIELDDLISKIKAVFDERFEELYIIYKPRLPSTPSELKDFISELIDQINGISEKYSMNLSMLSDINNKIKEQARSYYEKYKEAKNEFKKERKDYKEKYQILEKEILTNTEENAKIQNALKDVKNEVEFFKDKVGIKDSALGIIRKLKIIDEDLELMVEVINSLRFEVDINEGLNDNEKRLLAETLESYDRKDKKIIQEDNVFYKQLYCKNRILIRSQRI